MEAKVERLEVSAYKIPTDFPESDGTLKWHSTTLIVVRIDAGGKKGVGYTYSGLSAAILIGDRLRSCVVDCDALDIPCIWGKMLRTVRNFGLPGIASAAISGVDCALWDLKGKLLNVSLVGLLGPARKQVAVYGSGGFTSYPIEKLQQQLADWVSAGISRVKMKVGRNPGDDFERVKAAREAIGPKTELYVDANGAYATKQALAFAERYSELGVSWFEEPVVSSDLEGLHLLRDRAPPGMEIAAGEYGYDLTYFQRMLAARAVDVLQADATRCGVTGFLKAGTLAEAYQIGFSAHTAPSIHVHLCCAGVPARHIEYFHDHARIERMLFEGAVTPAQGMAKPDVARPGLGMEFKEMDAKRFLIT